MFQVLVHSGYDEQMLLKSDISGVSDKGPPRHCSLTIFSQDIQEGNHTVTKCYRSYVELLHIEVTTTEEFIFLD